MTVMLLGYIDWLKYETNQEAKRIAAERNGKTEGASERAIEVARNLLDVLDIQTTAEKTGLPIELVQELAGAKKQQ